MNYLKVMLTDLNEDLLTPINYLVQSKIGDQEFTSIALNDLNKYLDYVGNINIDSFYEPIGNKKIDKSVIHELLREGKQLYVISSRLYYKELNEQLKGLPVTFSFI